METKPFFHELPQADVDKLIAEKATWSDIMKKYDQPEWCGYPEALSGQLGCWTLTDLSKTGTRKFISKDWCSSCGLCKKL